MLKPTLAIMTFDSKNIQLQYQGFLNTPLLWKTNALNGIYQLKLTDNSPHKLTDISFPNIRLGKRVEQFVMSYLTQFKNIEIVTKNAQIQNGKITVGELDCILKMNSTPIHLEIVYKFYLYDPSTGSDELSHWIGPNRNDNLLKKLYKLADKQLPLLYTKHCSPLLEQLSLLPRNIQQRVYFKAQLFVPYQQKVTFTLLNKECLQGFYVYIKEMQQFNLCKFYIPCKMDWLLEVQTQVTWISYENFLSQLTVLIDQKKAGLYWFKFPNGTIHKFFVVWWD